MSPPNQSKRAARIVEIEAGRLRGKQPKLYSHPNPCKQCGGRIPGERRPNARHCSEKCAYASKLKPMIPTGRLCEKCGEAVPPTVRADAKYCSARCRERDAHTRWLRRDRDKIRRRSEHDRRRSPTLEEIVELGTSDDRTVAARLMVRVAQVAKWRERYGINEGFRKGFKELPL